MKHGAIFDMDGTLFDTESIYRQGWIEIADNFGVERKPELATAISGSNIADMPAIVHRFHPSVDEHEYVNQVIDFTKDKPLLIREGNLSFEEVMKIYER